MKYLILVTCLPLLFFSCKKENNSSSPNVKNYSSLFLKNVQQSLTDSLSSSDYENVDFTKVFKSNNHQNKENFYYVRIGFNNKPITTDFILLKTDSLGKITEGKIISSERTMTKSEKAVTNFSGSFNISSLNRTAKSIRQIVNGKWIKGDVSIRGTRKAEDEDAEEEPAGEQELPEVVVTAYLSDGGISGYWYNFSNFFSGTDGDGGDTYGLDNPQSDGGSSIHDDETIVIQTESNDEAAINVKEYIKCFGSVPDENATYKISIFTDIPVNGDPGKLFDLNTQSPGHSFIQLRKSSGDAGSVQQNIGFYPNTSWKSLTSTQVKGKVVDNESHEFNASLTLNLNATQFQAALNQIELVSGKLYDISNWNCTDFALSIFNAASGLDLNIPQYHIPSGGEFSNTPQGLYTAIFDFYEAGNTKYGTPDVPGVAGFVGDSHGPCQ